MHEDFKTRKNGMNLMPFSGFKLRDIRGFVKVVLVFFKPRHRAKRLSAIRALTWANKKKFRVLVFQTKQISTTRTKRENTRQTHHTDTPNKRKNHEHGNTGLCVSDNGTPAYGSSQNRGRTKKIKRRLLFSALPLICDGHDADGHKRQYGKDHARYF
jgi:hypothetical protein